MTENWRPYPNDPRYLVSDHGRVKGIKGQLMSPHTSGGYLRVSVRRRIIPIHTMVLETFCGPRPDGMEACHEDDVKTNNHISNLRWGTRKANTIDSVRNGTHANANKEVCIRGHLLEGPNVRVYKGRRSCWACRRAAHIISKTRRLKGVDISDQVDSLADSYYERIMSDVG